MSHIVRNSSTNPYETIEFEMERSDYENFERYNNNKKSSASHSSPSKEEATYQYLNFQLNEKYNFRI